MIGGCAGHIPGTKKGVSRKLGRWSGRQGYLVGLASDRFQTGAGTGVAGVPLDAPHLRPRLLELLQEGSVGRVGQAGLHRMPQIHQGRPVLAKLPRRRLVVHVAIPADRLPMPLVSAASALNLGVPAGRPAPPGALAGALGPERLKHALGASGVAVAALLQVPHGHPAQGDRLDLVEAVVVRVDRLALQAERDRAGGRSGRARSSSRGRARRRLPRPRVADGPAGEPAGVLDALGLEVRSAPSSCSSCSSDRLRRTGGAVGEPRIGCSARPRITPGRHGPGRSRAAGPLFVSG